MKAFISYASEEKQWGSYARRTLEELGMSPFLAHEDIAVSQEWQKRIAQELNDATIFVALLSKAFLASDWCSQEIGWIAARANVLVIPLSIDGTIPYGFMSQIQSQSIASEKDLDNALTSVLIRERPEKAIPAAIKRLEYARSFREAESRMQPLVKRFPTLTDNQAVNLVNAAIKNHEIWDAGRCRSEYLPQFLRLNQSRIAPEQFNLLATKIEYDGNVQNAGPFKKESK
jgi:hypothetical protein